MPQSLLDTGAFLNGACGRPKSQGKILIKLIDRETSRTGYEVIKEFRGGFQAFMWQSLAGLFGTNLKTGYDDQEDRDIELILQDIEGDRYQPPYKDR
jgi:hypothetical protein